MNIADFEAAMDLCSLAHIAMRERTADDYTADEVFRAKLLLTRLQARTPATFEATALDRELLATLARKSACLIKAGVFRGGLDLERTVERLKEVGVEFLSDPLAWLNHGDDT